ncbi:MAG: Spy/CpxP family protein refolding chaperone [Candidatus Obscuribacterales bacterium]|nr:Spy/CpxP family protein refolding chaperone [Candidatus Obscuribacterales bacterium]
MKLTRKFGLTAGLLTLLTPLLLSGQAIAGPSNAAPLIDKEFEAALRKFVCNRFCNRIDATDEQREKLSKIMTDAQEESRPLREDLRSGLLGLSDMMSDSKSNDEQIRAKVKELRSLHEKVQDRRISALLEARKVLNAEQRQEVNKRFADLITGVGKPRRLGFLMHGAQAFSSLE